MPLPAYVVELSFGSVAYVNISSYVTSVSINRGSTRVFDDTEVGQASINFTNFDRTFDPFNTSVSNILYSSVNGYTLVQPNAKVRITIGGVVSFVGWVQNWSFTNDEKGLNPQASLTATDGLGVLGKSNFNPALVTSANTATFPSSRISAATATYGSTAISLTYPSGKTPLGADTFDASTTVLSYLQNVARTEPFNFFGTKDGNAKIVDRSITNSVYSLGTPVFNLHKTAGWYNGTATDLSNWYFGGSVVGWGGSVVTNTQFPGEYLFASSTDNGGGIDLVDYWERDSTKYKTNQPYSLSFYTNCTDGAAYLNLRYVYLNGSSTVTKAAGSTAFTFPNGGWNKVTINNVSTSLVMNGLEFYAFGNAGPFQIKDLVITQATAVPTFYFDGERSQQTTDFLNELQIVGTGWTGVERNSTSVYLTKTATGGTTTLPGYEVFGDANGQVAVATAIPISDLQLTYSADQFYNQINVVRYSGGTATKNNSTSQGLYGIKSFSQTDSLGISPNRANDFANEIYAQYGTPDYYITSMDVQVESLSASYQSRILALDLFDLARVIFRPYGGGSNIDRTYQIISIDHAIGLESHVITFGLATISSGLYLNSTYLGILDTQKVV
jgi:hypothetical protein